MRHHRDGGDNGEEFDESWKPWKKRAWRMSHGIGLDRLGMSLPLLVLASSSEGDGEDRCVREANVRVVFHPGMLDGGRPDQGSARDPGPGPVNGTRM